MERQIKKNLEEAFAAQFGPLQGGAYFFAPSRINLIGEHIDYNGGRVLPCALSMGTYALAAPNQTGTLRLYSLNLQEKASLPLPPAEQAQGKSWALYPAGVYVALRKQGLLKNTRRGLDVVVVGNIPHGAGLSSSASLELVFGVLYNYFLAEGAIAMMDLVHAGVWCENTYLGLHTGIMDQYVIAFGQKDRAMLLDTAQERHQWVPFQHEGVQIVILNTNKSRRLQDSKYNERRAECEQALARIQKVKPIRQLCALTPSDLPLLDQLLEEPLRKRARYVVEENHRVTRAVAAMREKSWTSLGQLLRESHRGLQMDYEVSGPELDAICEAANAHPACYGARMTGAGFGGCAIALVAADQVEDFCLQVGQAYLKKTARRADFLFSEAGTGARLLEPVSLA